MRILVADGIDLDGAKLLKDAGFEVVEQKYTPEELVTNIKDYDAILVRSATKVPKEVIDAGVNLKAIARGGVGLDNIDVKYAAEKGIPVLNTPGASAISVAELAIAHMFAVSRFFQLSNTEMRQGKWPKKEYAKGRELTGKTLGLMGLGSIGKEVAKRAKGLMMDVIAFDPFVKENDLGVKMVSKDELLANADIISMHMPLIKGEPAPVGAPEFAKMKDGVIIVNCARGGTLDETALLDALNSGKVYAAALDVFVNEPVTQAQAALVAHPRVSVTPHIGASTNEAQQRVGTEIAQKLIDTLSK
jgi:D-3-phosphoglycerate dehydrogenase / 2-oxoglutarate reductase